MRMYLTSAHSVALSGYFGLLVPLVTFFFNDPAPTAIYTLSLHDALPICSGFLKLMHEDVSPRGHAQREVKGLRSEEPSELQSRGHLVCRLLLEKKKKTEGQTEPHGIAGAPVAYSPGRGNRTRSRVTST